ncbi:MAG TPA: hypothetical protein VHC69_31705 [Polyangiaceae bacterium]|nr:hypothetical protein [Polyangiaceae bacterium]
MRPSTKPPFGISACLKLRIDDIGSDGRPGFRVLAEEPGRELVVGAVGKLWHLNIPFADIRSKDAFRSFDQPGFAKVAWAVRVSPRGERGSHIEFEVRVRATDAESLRAFRRYFAIIGPASRFIRRHLLGLLGHELGALDAGDASNPRIIPAKSQSSGLARRAR